MDAGLIRDIPETKERRTKMKCSQMARTFPREIGNICKNIWGRNYRNLFLRMATFYWQAVAFNGLGTFCEPVRGEMGGNVRGKGHIMYKVCAFWIKVYFVWIFTLFTVFLASPF